MSDGQPTGVLGRETIVDTDVHLSVPGAELAKHVGGPHRDWGRTLSNRNSGDRPRTSGSRSRVRAVSHGGMSHAVGIFH